MPESASLDEIRTAYRSAARIQHPDAAGSEPGADMAAVNDAWWVLSDPGRRAMYDRSVLGASPAAGMPTRVAAHEGTETTERWVPRTATGQGGRFPIWPFVIVFILAGIFIFTAGALSKEPVKQGPDNMLSEGSCVVIEANGDAREVDCAGAHEAVVVTIVGFDAACPSNTETRRDRQGRGYACLTAG